MKPVSFLPLLFISILLTAQKQTKMTIHFDLDKASIRPVDAKLLDSLIATFKENSTPGIEIYGHCDMSGTNDYNDTLSFKRARSVKKYLLAKGVELSSIKKELGYGETMPVVDTGTIYRHRYNRRVELIITKGNSISEENTISKILNDTTTKAGTIIIMKNLNFEGGMHRLLKSSLPALYDLLNALQQNENLVIRIEGHICCVPDAGDGYDFETGTRNLSEERAKVIYNFLIKNQIKQERLSFVGFGHQRPIYRFPERNEGESLQNRRVEIRVIRK